MASDWDAVPVADVSTADAMAAVLHPWRPYDGDELPTGPGGWLGSEDLCAWMRERTDHVLVGFSTGKDSIATYLRLRHYWPSSGLHLYHLYLHPHIGMIERNLRYYEREFDLRILRLPNRSVYRFLNDGVMLPPHALPVVWGAELWDFTYPDLYDQMAIWLGIADDNPWVAHGVRAGDSPMRRMLISRHGPWRPTERVFYPLWDWYVADVRRVLTETGIKLPVDYRLFGRSFDGLDHRFTAPLREAFPEDYDALADLYPLIGLDSWRRGGEAPDE